MSEMTSTQARQLLAPLREESPAPSDARARVRNNLAALIPAIGAGVGGGNGGGPSQQGAPPGDGVCSVPEVRPSGVAQKTLSPTGVAPAAVRSTGTTLGRLAGLLTGPFVPIATFLVGGVTGAALFAALSPSSNPHAQTNHAEVAAVRGAGAGAGVGAGIAAPAPNETNRIAPMSAEAPAAPTPRETPTEGPVADRVRGAPEKAAPVGRVPQLSAERRILDEARARLVQGDPNRSLEQLDHHRQKFPKGMLAEERDAMQVQALVDARRYDQARASAAAFQARTPNSLFMPAIESAIAAIP